VDTAGIREANDEIEKIGIEKSLEAINEADIIISLFDGSRIFDEEDQKIVTLLEETIKEKIIVINKVDLEQKLDLEKIGEDVTFLNAKENISELINAIETILNQNTSGDDITLISKQQVNEVESTLQNISESTTPLERGELEFFAHHINEALTHMSNITRPYEHTQMLDVMFGEFCLGK